MSLLEHVHRSRLIVPKIAAGVLYFRAGIRVMRRHPPSAAGLVDTPGTLDYTRAN